MSTAKEQQALEVTRKVNSVRDLLTSPAAKERIFSALPKHITAERMIQVVMTSIRKNPKLLDCTQASLFAAITQAAQLGLETDGVLGWAYLIPYGKEVVLVPGYKGLLNLARRSGEISTITLECVHEGDAFSYGLGDKPFVNHAPSEDEDRETRPIDYVYVVFHLRDGGIIRQVRHRNWIDAHKKRYSKGWAWAESGDKKRGGGKKDSPWHENWPEMAMKTVVRYAINRGLVPVSVELQRMANQEEVYDAEFSRLEPSGALPAPETLDALTETLEAPTNDAEGGAEETPPGPMSQEQSEAADGNLFEKSQSAVEAGA